jgi:pyruvate dehydrogenase E2 component (dihydrolipoamide acetyltransferase)
MSNTGVDDPKVPMVQTYDYTLFGDVEEHAVDGLHQAMARRLTASWREVPHVTHFDEVDIIGLEVFRRDRNETPGDDDTRISLLALIVSAVSKTLGEFPDFNASLAPDGKTLYRKAYCNIGIAVDTDAGLLVPVLHNVQDMDLAGTSSAIASLADRARSGKLKNDDIEGASFTVTSLGKLGGIGFTPIINAPEVAILGVARAQERAVVQDGKIAARLILPLSLSYDHRVVDGAAAGRFMDALRRRLTEMPATSEKK